MKEEVWKSPYETELVEVRVINRPRSAELILSKGSAVTKIILVNPKCSSQIVEAIDQCWEIVILDKNIRDNNQLEFGQYLLQINDEDNVVAEIQCDDFSIEEIQS